MQRNDDRGMPQDPRGRRHAGVSFFLRAFSHAVSTLSAAARPTLLALCITTAAACSAAPETLPAALEAALGAGDEAAIAALLTEDSRTLYATLLDADHPAGRHPFGAHPPKRPTTVVSRTEGSDGSVILRVSDGSAEAEWVLRRESGNWRLDLAATSSRLPFFGL
jgi:hypothetical protein